MIYKKKDFQVVSFFKKFLKYIGIKFALSQIFNFILKTFFKSKIPFIRGLLFETLKLNGNYAIITNSYNEKFIIFTDDKVISKEIYINGEFDFKKLYKTLNFLKSRKNKVIDNLFDIGANIGVICIPAVKRGLVQKAYAVEPETENYKLLKTNIILNDLDNKIIPYNYALSNLDNEIIKMELSNNNFGDHRIRDKVKFNIHGEEKRKIIDVKTKKFDTLFENVLSDKDLIWIDTQGYEPKVLRGAQSLIYKKIPTVVEFWPYALKRSDLWEDMIKLIKKFDLMVDLAKDNLTEVEINEKNLFDLTNGWSEEVKHGYAIHTDILLIKD